MNKPLPTPDGPCYKCTDRELGCHSRCNKYKDFLVQNEARREAERAARKDVEYFAETKARSYFYKVRKYSERKGWGGKK